MSRHLFTPQFRHWQAEEKVAEEQRLQAIRDRYFNPQTDPYYREFKRLQIQSQQLDRKGGWTQTIGGRQFWPVDPRVEDIDIKDIAHALALVNRYNGHTKEPYCPTPEQRILTSDLRWVPAGDLKVGDRLFAFDENPVEPGSAGVNRRRFRPSVVEATFNIKRRVFRLEMADGSTVRTSAEHPWLVATKISRNQAWVKTEDLASALAEGRKRYMHKFIQPWQFLPSREAGWLAGIYDGEGHFSSANRRGTQMGVAQKTGLVLDEMERLLRGFGFKNLRTEAKSPGGTVMNLQILGGWRENVRLLGAIRPLRLLNKFEERLFAGELNKQLDSDGAPLEIVRAYDEGEQWIAGLQTSTRTYFCEGYGAHNCVAQHSVIVSYECDPVDAFWGLLHDASEAYLGDMVSPLKREMPEYKAVETYLMGVICDKFGMDQNEPPSVKKADLMVLAAESRDLFPVKPADWNLPYPPVKQKIKPVGWKKAEAMFLARFEELWSKRRLTEL